MNQDNKQKQEEQKASSYWNFTSRNYFLFLLGTLLLVVGFVLLCFVDPRAENIFGVLSPILIISAYITVFVSLLVDFNK